MIKKLQLNTENYKKKLLNFKKNMIIKKILYKIMKKLKMIVKNSSKLLTINFQNIPKKLLDKKMT
jgi:hypothetical protein